MEPRIPEPRDDDPEEVADKLSIAAAMWGRGDRADALTWLRRAAESASDAEQDMRALELAKAASELAPIVESSEARIAGSSEARVAGSSEARMAAAAASPMQPPPSQASPPSSGPPSSRSAMGAPAGDAPASPKTSQRPPPKPSQKPPPKPSARPPSSRPPGAKLPPLPPLRPLGAPAPPAKAPRIPSMVTSAGGQTTASGHIQRETPAQTEASKPMPWDEASDDEPTNQIALPDDPVPADPEVTRQYDATDLDRVREAQMRDEAPPSSGTHVPASAPESSARVMSAPASSEHSRATQEPAYVPLAVGVRVRVIVEDQQVRVVSDDGSTEGVAAILVPVSPDDDLRTVFARRR